MRRLLLLILALVLGVLPASGTGTTATFTYDAPATTRFHSYQDSAALAGLPRETFSHVASGSGPGLAAGTSATPSVVSVATNTGTRTFGSGKPPHVADVTVTRNGEVVSQQTLRSGNMTPDEAALGFPRSTLATHTEARAVRNTPLEAGDDMLISGQYPPCPSCKGAMNQATRSSGASITYQWPDGTWTAGG